MRFVDFLKATVLLSAGAATTLGVITIAAAANTADDKVVFYAVGWWVVATIVGGWVGRRNQISPAIATGFTIIWALAWRRQESAVRAIEERDGVTFFVEPTSPFRPIRLVRMPGFRREVPSLNGTEANVP